MPKVATQAETIENVVKAHVLTTYKKLKPERRIERLAELLDVSARTIYLWFRKWNVDLATGEPLVKRLATKKPRKKELSKNGNHTTKARNARGRGPRARRGRG
jgi:transposase